MRKKITLLLFALPYLLGATNLLTNPGFENATWDEGWFANKATIVLETGAANIHSGSNACAVTVTGAKGGIRTNNIDGLTAGTYIGGAWIKSDAGNEFKVQMVVTTLDGTSTQYLTNNVTDKTTGTWQHISVPFALEDGDKYKLVIQSFTTDITFYVDDLELIAATTINNGNLEEGIDKFWSDVALKNGAEATISEEHSIVSEGSKAMKIVITKEGSSNSWGDVQAVSSSLVAFNGAAKVISFYAKADVAEGKEAIGGFGFGYKNKYGKHQGGENNYGGFFDLTNEYRNYKWAINTTDYSTFVYANASFRCGPSTGSYFLDNVTLEAYPGAPTITSLAVDKGKVGSSYEYQAESSTPNLGRWKMSKPAGLSLTIDGYTGLISGTPDTAGVFDIVVAIETGVDSVGQAFTLTIEAALGTSRISNENLVRIYPTIVEDLITISSNQHVAEVAIYNLAGKSIMQEVNPNNILNISNLKQGMYLLKLTVNDKQSIKKFYKK